MKKYITISVIFLTVLYLGADLGNSPSVGDWIGILILEFYLQMYLQKLKP